MARAYLECLIRGESLSRGDAAGMMRRIVSGELSDVMIAGLLVALREKRETADEIAGFVDVMRDHVVRVAPERGDLLDTCGTGGDATKTFNISTATALVAAGMGIGVAKHGNRAVSSSCGSADVLEALGVDLSLPPRAVARLIDRVGIGFLFAQRHHPAMKRVAAARKALGVRTVFNVLGPLTNPAGVRRQLLGVFDGALTEPLARALGSLGARRAFVVHGFDGCDEVSICADTRVSEWRDGTVRTFNFSAASIGLGTARLDDIAGGDASANARRIESILSGETGPARDAVVANSAFAAVAAGHADDLAAGARLAENAIDSGAAAAALDGLRTVSRELAAAVGEAP